MIELANIEAARNRLQSWVRHTPVLSFSNLQAPFSAAKTVHLKLECLQVTGSFKARGAMNRLLTASKEDYQSGIVTASGGNHGLAVARTAFVANVPSTIFVPKGVSAAKVQKMIRWKARVEVAGTVWDECNAAALEYSRKTGALYFHPFADPEVVAGQGTLGLEIVDDLPHIDVLLVAIGGGGLIAGVSTAIKALRPSIRIIGVEPIGSPTLKASLDAGHCVTLAEVTTRVPTMACKRTDERILEIVRKNVDEIVLVSDEELEEASRLLWFEGGIAADLSGAASIAALKRGFRSMADANSICAIVCGAGPDGIAVGC